MGLNLPAAERPCDSGAPRARTQISDACERLGDELMPSCDLNRRPSSLVHGIPSLSLIHISEPTRPEPI
eukprot:6717636-Pyramimonas_sp.AAC.1